MSLLNKLWNSGIKAEGSYKESPRANKQMDHVNKNQIPLVIWLGEEELKQNKIKFRVNLILSRT